MHESKILVTYDSPVKTGEKMRIKLQMPNRLGYVNDAQALFNRRGELPGKEKKVYLMYEGDESNERYSTFRGEATFETPGYRTFYIRLKLNGTFKELSFDEETETVVISDTSEKSFWQTFVYYSTFETPDFVKGGIMYQIYVDTFCSKDLPEHLKDRVVDWGTPPKWKPDPDGEYRNDQRYGGNLKGIISKLDYIKSLSVTVLYVTPIFESATQDGYGIDDYEKISQLIGTWDDLEELHEECNKRGIALVLDIVFNHSGPNNPLLKEEPEMYEWEEKYTIYKGWWGYKLPEFNKYSDKYSKLLQKLVKLYSNYVDGFRIDVADNLPDFVLKYIRKIFGKYLLLEVWKNSITGEFREFLYGDEGDGVMNYQFSNAIYRYVRYGNVRNFKKVFRDIITLYPPEALDVSPIFLSSHDIPRIPNIITNELMKNSEKFENVWDIDKDERWYVNGKFDTYAFRKWETENRTIPKEKEEETFNLQKQIVFLQYTLPGLPSIFAGDEVGVLGLKDPDNRRTFPWDNPDEARYEFYCEIGEFRMKYRAVFSDSKNFKPIYCDEEKFIYQRANMLFMVNISRHELVLEEEYQKQRVYDIQPVSDSKVIPKYGAFAMIIE